MAKSILPQGAGPAERVSTVYGSDVFSTGHNILPNKEPEQQPELEPEQQDDASILEEAREFLDRVETADAENRTRGAEMLRFCYRRGSQWPDKIRREREGDNRPCLEINMMPSFVNQVVNDERQNRPAIKVRPTSDDATEQLAEIRQDLIRHIEYDSNASQVYDNGFRYAVAANCGYWRLTTEYEAEDSFYQKICIKPIRDIFSVYYDPDCKEPDGDDAEKCLVTEELGKEEYERRYPDAAPIDWQTTDPILTAWIKPDSIRIADYYHKVYYKDVLYQLLDGSTAWKSEIPSPPSDSFYSQQRDVQRVKVAWEVINGIEVLERHEWAGTGIPIIPCWGDVTFVEGETIRQGLVERAQDMQQMYNFWVTTAAEAAALQPKAPFLVAEGQIDGREREWGNANTKPMPYLTYRRNDETGKDLGQPQRSSPDVDVSGMLNQATVCQANMRSTIGIADPLATMQVQDESGRAILAKERMAATATFHFIDNLSRAIRLTGKRLLDLIPHIYDTERTLQLLREDGTQYKKTVNQQPLPSVDGSPLQDTNSLKTGDYDVIVDVGPSYQSKRVEFVNSVMELTQSNPDLWKVAGDLLVHNMDWPGADDVADRLKVMLPPQIAALEANKSQDPQVVAMGQQLQQLQQQSQQQMQAMAAEHQKVIQENQSLQSQNYSLKAQSAGKDAKMQGMQAQVQQKMAETQADILEQRMESADVRLQAQTDLREQEAKERIDQQKLAGQMWKDREEMAIKRDQTTLQAFETLAQIVEKLGPQAGAEGAQVVEQELPGAVSALEGNATPAAPQQLTMDMQPLADAMAPMHQSLMQHGAALEGVMQGMGQLMQHAGETHALLTGMGQQPAPAAAAPTKAAKRKYRIYKDKDGSMVGESYDDGEAAE